MKRRDFVQIVGVAVVGVPLTQAVDGGSLLGLADDDHPHYSVDSLKFSENAAMMLKEYLIMGGVDPGAIDHGSFARAAAYCDEWVLPPEGPHYLRSAINWLLSILKQRMIVDGGVFKIEPRDDGDIQIITEVTPEWITLQACDNGYSAVDLCGPKRPREVHF